MSDLASISPSPAGSGAGLASESGLADHAPAGTIGTPAPPRELPGATAPERGTPGLPDSPPDWKKRYEDTQSAYTKQQQALAELGGLEIIRQNQEFQTQLLQQPEFLKWAAERLQAQQTPQQPPLDPETVKALRLVQAMIHHENARINGPLYQKAAEQHRDAVWGQMSKEFGPDWLAHRDKILELHQENLQAGRSDAFDFKYLAHLYRAARAGDPEWVLQEGQRQLREKQANVTTASPGTAPAAVGGAPVKDLRDAFHRAKRIHGLA